MTIKPLDGTAVLCEDPGCEKPAVYLFSQAHPVVVCVAYCETHGVRFAERLCLPVPHTRRAVSAIA